mgnify:CR=1 FL=1
MACTQLNMAELNNNQREKKVIQKLLLIFTYFKRQREWLTRSRNRLGEHQKQM